MKLKTAFFLASLTAALCLSGCGGGGAATTMIAGSVTGLNDEASVVLKNNGTNAVTVSANGSFFFNGQVKAGTAYAVTVSENPAGENCKVTNGTGIVGQYSEDVSNIVVTCTPTNGTVYGVVSGLAAGASLTLEDIYSAYGSSTSDSLHISANGPFIFQSNVKPGYTYGVIVSTQPTGQTCSVTDGTGDIPATGGIQAVQVKCN